MINLDELNKAILIKDRNSRKLQIEFIFSKSTSKIAPYLSKYFTSKASDTNYSTVTFINISYDTVELDELFHSSGEEPIKWFGVIDEVRDEIKWENNEA